ncbi:PE family protein [Nocardia harenae]|uniref:PE family protein n=1 Tax=Nocardia harenae TaxID=358707 RepID=UPI00082A5C9C|nr:PE family protein [Nocardia harenae]
MSGESTGHGFDGVRFDPEAAARASTGLDGLADRLAAELQAVEEALRIPPAGVDEVSGRAAVTSNDVAASYLSSAQAGVHEVRKLAAALRQQTTEFDRLESETVASLETGSGTVSA